MIRFGVKNLLLQILFQHKCCYSNLYCLDNLYKEIISLTCLNGKIRYDHTSVQCLQTMKKTAFESLSRDFSSFKNFVVSVTNMCQGQWKISPENVKLPKKPRRNLLSQNINWHRLGLLFKSFNLLNTLHGIGFRCGLLSKILVFFIIVLTSKHTKR